ncbi:nucleotide sugar dehydrogenase [Eubacterium sp. 1001713B170207_170306_E7]|uniref:nucleotide sugar dehydrogenase n=1 Tax=Eubacterium sp. 1001713B170207_170306_E7 TaxID=2787097 RepID=UPI00189BDE60|nr:nucleotide sugar dehydrogenase [Eubacterium sp. 1001713B170207_170306_E7]
MRHYEALKNRETKLSVIGLGYVGLPIAVAFSKTLSVIGFDTNGDKIDVYRQGEDPTREVGSAAVKNCGVHFTADEKRLKEARFHIVAVPTPIKEDKSPELGPVEEASRILGRNLKEGSVVVYESTVYPGVTEEVCVPLLEEASGLQCGRDFKVGYSPERINPGDKVHRLENIVKIVSGMDEETLETVAEVYSLVALAGVHRAESIRVAEAAKIIENSQRDINIAFMNELSIIFNRMDIDTQAVLEAAGTKWNFLDFTPGLVGGHCIGVDPYYLTHKAEELGYRSQVILSGRRINDGMGRYVAENAVKQLIKQDMTIPQARVGILGFTFKENCPDTRNTKVMDIIRELREYGIEPLVCDPEADAGEAREEYGVELADMSQLEQLDLLMVAVAHQCFEETAPEKWTGAFKNQKEKILFDLKGIYDREACEACGYTYWRL